VIRQAALWWQQCSPLDGRNSAKNASSSPPRKVHGRDRPSRGRAYAVERASAMRCTVLVREEIVSKGPFGLPMGARRLLEQNQELGRAGGDACCTGGFDPAFTCVGTVLSSNARAQIHARLMGKARVRADSSRVRSTNDTSLRMPLKKETPLPCSGSQSRRQRSCLPACPATWISQ
jgi:hypothetical protein